MKDDDKNIFNIYELKRATADVKEVKEEIKDIYKNGRERDNRLNDVEKRQAVMESKLNTIIKNTEKTNTIIQQAIYGAIASAVIGGIIAIVWSQVGGG